MRKFFSFLKEWATKSTSFFIFFHLPFLPHPIPINLLGNIHHNHKHNEQADVADEQGIVLQLDDREDEHINESQYSGLQERQFVVVENVARVPADGGDCGDGGDGV